MEKNTISIIAKNSWSADFLKKQMEDLFGFLFKINCHSPDTFPVLPIHNSDMIILHEPSVLEIMQKYIKCDCPVLLMRRTITAEALDKIRTIPEGAKTVVVNLNDYMARETLVNIYQLGIKNIQLSSWSPEATSFPEVDYIITPRDYNFLPKNNIPKIIIGSRILTIELIMDILTYFNINTSIISRIINTQLECSPNFFHGVKHILESNKYLSAQLDLIFNKINKGVAIVDKNNVITYANALFSSYLNLDQDILLNMPLDKLVSINNSLEFITENRILDNNIIDLEGRKIIVNIDLLNNENKYMGKIITLQSYEEVQHVQQAVQNKITSNGASAKYFFTDLKGNDPEFLKCINLGKKFSNSNLPVLISGDSGTGKELIASAIHNASPRRNKPYIAVNCGSIPNELLEAEFFGYVEGAFTGSKKGGKIGLFEKANGGTIFLDEISEIPYKLQSRLLRVLEEHEIRKVGSNYNLKIDVRVISATNQNLYKLVEDNGFRKDLYYRLNVLQLNLPPLQKRKSDIEPMLNFFLDDYKNKVNRKVYKFLSQYSWPGNIRELKNLANYLIVTSDEVIDIKSLPEYLKIKKIFENINIINNLSLIEYLVLEIIQKNECSDSSTGRRVVKEVFGEMYFDISEMEVRNILSSLNNKGFIEIFKGRRGCRTTLKGRNLLSSNT